MYNQNFSKSASSKILISPLTNMIQKRPLVFFFLDTSATGIPGKETICKYLTLLEICRFELTLKIEVFLNTKSPTKF
jgi:hypothetical protein